MSELKIPQHPTLDLKCHKCKHWIKSIRRNYVITPGGPMEVHKPVHEIPIEQTWANMAPCTYNPNWQLTSKDHWCNHCEQTMKFNGRD